MNYKKILITGGAGFIGSNLALNLKRDYSKVDVIAFDNLKRKGSHLNLERLKKRGVKFIHGDVRNREDFEQISEFDLMIECSAEPSVSAGYSKDPGYLINTNLTGTINCLEAVRKNRADLIFLSTSRVYPIEGIRGLNYKISQTRYELKDKQHIHGISKKGISENFPLQGARSLYGTTKLASELLIQEYIHMYNLRAVINRCSIIAGPWQMGKVDQGILAHWIISHYFKKPLKYIGYGGKQVRDVLHINDLYELLKIQINNIKRMNNEIYNVSGGYKNSFSLLELTEICQNIVNNKVKISKSASVPKFDIPFFISDSSKILKISGWRPQKNLNVIIKDLLSWIIEHKNILKAIL